MPPTRQLSSELSALPLEVAESFAGRGARYSAYLIHGDETGILH